MPRDKSSPINKDWIGDDSCDDDDEWDPLIDGDTRARKGPSLLDMIKANNRNVHEKLSKLDGKPGINDEWWQTLLIYPKNVETTTDRHVQIQFDLSKERLLRGSFSKTIIAVEKRPTQLVLFFALDVVVHVVLGGRGAAKVADIMDADIKLLRNDMNQRHTDEHPLWPAVINEHNVMGLTDDRMFRDFSIPRNLLGTDLLTQYRSVMIGGLVNGLGDEFVELAHWDTRGILAFDSGVNNNCAESWKRRGGCGIALPGIIPNSKKASDEMRKWISQLTVLQVHVLIERCLKGTARENQGLVDQVRWDLMSDYREYLQLPATVTRITRMVEANTLQTGSVSFHQDHGNDRENLQNHISLGSVYVESWKKYLTKDANVHKMKKAGVAVENTMFNSLCYMRWICGSQAKKLQNKSDLSCCSYALELAQIIDMEEDALDISTLSNEAEIMSANNYLRNNKRTGQTSDYGGQTVKTEEGTNRYIFLGTMAYMWLLFVEKYYGVVKWRHRDEYTAFVAREINGSPLCIRVMLASMSADWKTSIERALEGSRGQLYVTLVKVMKAQRGGDLNAVTCSSHFRWQNFERSLWTGDNPLAMGKVKRFLHFVTTQFSALTNGTKKQRDFAIRMIGSTMV